jgi:two-component system, cell cycle sensor histidine kinase and response regulator CckA
MNETLRVLQVEDSESDAALIARLLQKAGYDVCFRRVEDAHGMRAALEGAVWDVIIADHHMSRFDAPGALRILHETGQDIPFLIVSGSIGEELAVAMMKSGAHDYLNKDNLARLVPAVAREIREVRSRRERLQAERDLRASEERLALAIQATQLGTFDFSPQTGKLIWSELTRRHFGLPPDAEVSYDTFLKGLHPDDRQRADTTIQNLLLPDSDGEYASEYRTIGIEDHATRWVSSWGRVFFDPDGKPVRFVGVTLDTTERKKLEDQFRQAQKLESLGSLAGGVAHDFNNLLTIINGYSDLMLPHLDTGDRFHNYVAEIRKAGGRAVELTQQLLAFSRKQVIEPRPLNLNQLVADSRNMLARLIGEDIELVTLLGQDLDDVFADGGQLHQVLMNLVVNARDAMPEGGRITIETANAEFGRDHTDAKPEAHRGEYVLLIVADSGVGMDEETSKRVFEPFFTTKREGVGTGLGLATVYGIVRQCGGWIDFTTKPGEGTTFTIGLPRTVAPVALDCPPRRSSGLGGAETVLVVEDQDEVRGIVVMALKTRGYQLLEARNGAEALSIAENHVGPIHLLLTDVVMPGMNGKELADRLRRLRSNIRVLFMSGYSDNVIVNRTASDDVDYIAKPFTPQPLADKVRALLGDATRLRRRSHGVG